MSVDVGVDIGLLKSEIKKTYASVSQEPEKDFVFPTGRAWAEDLGYPPALLARVPETAAESFAGVANPFSLGSLQAGERVLDIGCGAGMDSLVAAQMGGPQGSGTGIHLTPGMLRKGPRGPGKAPVFPETHRVPAPGGRTRVADVTIQQPVSEEGRRNIDLWTG